LQRAVELNPKDATSIHLLGYWYSFVIVIIYHHRRRRHIVEAKELVTDIVKLVITGANKDKVL